LFIHITKHLLEIYDDVSEYLIQEAIDDGNKHVKALLMLLVQTVKDGEVL